MQNEKGLLFCKNFFDQEKAQQKKGPFIQKVSIKITPNAKSLSSFSGLNLFVDLFSKFDVAKIFAQYLPQKIRDRGISSSQKFFSAVLGFIAGAECLDDFDSLGFDPLFSQLTGSPSAITLGKFLRGFSLRQIEQIGSLLPIVALRMRSWLRPSFSKIIFRMDGTSHQQFGEKMEGVEWNYKNIRCLSSQNLFDDLGLCYGFTLRAGAVHSSVGAIEMMERAFKSVPLYVQKYFVADSAYASLEIYNTLLVNKVSFAICLPEPAWRPLLENYGSKVKWESSKIKFFGQNKCEIGSCIYSKKGLSMGRKFLRVVFIRTKKKEILAGDNHPYHYYAIVTDLSYSEMNNEQVIKFYRKRAQVENNIKDLKNGMDFHHFPCQSLKANNVWGLMGIIAYNLMRVASFALYPQTGCFVKTVRRNLVTIAGEVICHARSLEIRLMNFLAKEVNRLSMILSSAFLRMNVRIFEGTNVPP